MIKLISSMAPREMLADLIARYQKSTSRTVVAEAVGGVDVARRVQEGESFDVVVLTATAIDQLISAGKVLAGSRVDLVKSGVALAVRTGAPVPDISTEDAVKRAVMAASSISYSTGPSGVYLLKLFERWGILDSIKPRIVQAPPGVPVGSLVATGGVALGFQQLSELINMSRVTVVGPLPPAIQTITTFSAGVSATSLQAGLGAALIAFMAAPEADAAKRKQGMEPA